MVKVSAFPAKGWFISMTIYSFVTSVIVALLDVPPGPPPIMSPIPGLGSGLGGSPDRSIL